MDDAWRHAQNTWRMDSFRNGTTCRHFINGFCRFGSRCNYRHEWPVAQSSQICRYFQKGGCWYGERCRYLHVRQPEVATGVPGRRSSVPVVSSSSVGHAPPDRRGSEPALLQAEVTSRRQFNSSESVANFSEPPHISHATAGIVEEQLQDTDSQTASQELSQSSEVAQAGACERRNDKETTSSETTEDGAAAAASSTLGRVEEEEAFLQSKNVTCGICMDKVYEKTDPRHHVFGILPNCNHSFCLQCIMTWRKTRDLGPDVVKSCPQCRVKSAFYVPNKYWVEGEAKESVVATFKEKFRWSCCAQMCSNDTHEEDFSPKLAAGQRTVLCTAAWSPTCSKPLVCLFPPLFKQNLLSFIHLVHSALPQTSVLRLLNCLSQDLHPNHWVSALSRQLERSLSDHSEEPLYTPLCSQRLQDLSQRLVGFGETRGWKCLSRQSAESVSQSGSGLSDLVKQKKRKGSFVTVDSHEEEMGQQSKKIKMDVCGSEHVDAENWSIQKETSRAAPGEIPDEEMQQAPDSLCDALPERIKVTVLQIQELLESQTEWDQSSTNVFKVLSDCDPNQVEVLCSKLNFPDLPEQTLPKLCSSIVALCPDLSFSTAATLIKSLLLEKVLSLSEPASRCLVTTVMSLCNHYPRPMCHALIRPVLEEKNIGNPQAELLNRLINDCMDSHYRLLVLQMTFKVAWSEAVLSIIHSLFDSKPDLSEELFTQFTEELVSQGPQFTKSVKFAKVMLTVLTKHNSHMTAAHKHSLNGCLVLNETFLKKSLQTALKRITPTH